MGNYVTRPPSLHSLSNANSISLPESPMGIPEYKNRTRSNSLRVLDDILLRRSSFIKQAPIVDPTRRKGSLQDNGVEQFSTTHNNSIRIAFNEDNIGIKVTPPENLSPNMNATPLDRIYNRGQSMTNLTTKPFCVTSSRHQLCYGSTNSLSPTIFPSPDVNLQGTIV